MGLHKIGVVEEAVDPSEVMAGDITATAFPILVTVAQDVVGAEVVLNAFKNMEHHQRHSKSLPLRI